MKTITITSDGPIMVPEAVLKGLEAVRKSGLTNMCDRPRVAEIAEMLGFGETAMWIKNNRSDYANGLFRGFRSKEGTDVEA